MLPNPFGTTVDCTVVGRPRTVGSSERLLSQAASRARLATATDARRSARASKERTELIVGILVYVVQSIGGCALLRGGLGSARRKKRFALTGFPRFYHPV